MNIDHLDQALEVAEKPGMDTLDPRFADITTLIENGDYLAAATQAEEILDEGVYDIRIIGYFLYGVFLERGVGVLGIIFTCQVRLLTENWEALGPVKNRPRHAQTSLSWLLRQTLKKLQYEEEKKDDLWQRWVEEVSSDDVQTAIDAGEAFQRALGQALEDSAGPPLDGLAKINAWLKTFQHAVYREPEPEPEPDSQPSAAPAAPKDAGLATPSAVSEGHAAAVPEGSYHLRLLSGKLAAFDRLIQAEQYPRAAIVADDIKQCIQNFDPRIYFPKMFSRYSLLLALNIGELAAFDEAKGSVEWQALQDLYRVDLDSFVGFDAGTTFSTSQTPLADVDEDEGDDEREYDDDDEEEEDSGESEASPEDWD